MLLFSDNHNWGSSSHPPSCSPLVDCSELRAQQYCGSRVALILIQMCNYHEDIGIPWGSESWSTCQSAWEGVLHSAAS